MTNLVLTFQIFFVSNYRHLLGGIILILHDFNVSQTLQNQHPSFYLQPWSQFRKVKYHKNSRLSRSGAGMFEKVHTVILIKKKAHMLQKLIVIIN